MKLTLFAGATAALLLSAGVALAAEGCECCKDMAADAEMTCCDKMEAPATPETPQAPAEPAPAPAPATPQ